MLKRAVWHDNLMYIRYIVSGTTVFRFAHKQTKNIILVAFTQWKNVMLFPVNEIDRWGVDLIHTLLSEAWVISLITLFDKIHRGDWFSNLQLICANAETWEFFLWGNICIPHPIKNLKVIFLIPKYNTFFFCIYLEDEIIQISDND